MQEVLACVRAVVPFLLLGGLGAGFLRAGWTRGHPNGPVELGWAEAAVRAVEQLQAAAKRAVHAGQGQGGPGLLLLLQLQDVLYRERSGVNGAREHLYSRDRARTNGQENGEPRERSARTEVKHVSGLYQLL